MGGSIQQQLAIALGFTTVSGGNFLPLVLQVSGVGLVLCPELHPDQVDHALEVASLAGGNGAESRDNGKLLLHLLDATVKIGTGPVEFVDEGDARHAVLVGLMPDRFALDLDAADSAKDADGAVQYPQAALDLSSKVHVAGRINERNLVVVPFHRYSRAVDGNALGLFQRIEVGGGIPLVHIAGFVFRAAEVEDAFRGCGLSRLHVSDNADIMHFVKHDCQPVYAMLAAAPTPPQKTKTAAGWKPFPSPARLPLSSYPTMTPVSPGSGPIP